VKFSRLSHPNREAAGQARIRLISRSAIWSRLNDAECAVKLEIVGPICRNHPLRLDGKESQANGHKVISKSGSPLIPLLGFPTVELVPCRLSAFDGLRSRRRGCNDRTKDVRRASPDGYLLGNGLLSSLVMPFELLVAGGGSAELLPDGGAGCSGGRRPRRTGSRSGVQFTVRLLFRRNVGSGRSLRIRAFRSIGFIGRLVSGVFQPSRRVLLFMRYALVGE
jgi:hypothetical protein